MSVLILSAAQQRLDRGVTPFLGEVLASEFITGDALAAKIGLTAGVSQYSNEPWLKFHDPVDDKIKYVARKPLRHSLSWAQLSTVGAVNGKVVQINGNNYRVRLLGGIGKGPIDSALDAKYDHPATHGSEWNRLLYHISGKPFELSANSLSSEGIEEGDWARYREGVLMTHHKFGNGTYCWCRESGSAPAVYRGGDGVSVSYYQNRTVITAHRGWRPVLELIE